MPAHLKYSGFFAFALDGFVEMRFTYFYPFASCWSFEALARLEKMFDLSKNPWISDRRPSNHDSVDFKLLAPGCRLLHRVHVSIAKNRNMYAGVPLYVPDHGPVGLPFIHLRTRATVDREGFYADVL